MKKNYKKLTFKTKADWLEAKNNTIGGSEAAIVVNKNPWQNANDLYNKLVLHKSKAIPENERMKEGTLAEEHIRALFGLDNKDFIIKNPPKRGYWFYFRKDKPYISCTPDGLAKRVSTGKLWGIEIKDVELRKKASKELWLNNQLPDHYYFQTLQYLVTFNDMEGVVLVAHLKHYKHEEETDSWVFDYAEDRPYYIYREDVKSHISFLEKKETEFMEININGRKRPKLVISV